MAHSGFPDGQAVGDLPGRETAFFEEFEDRAAIRVGQGLENCVHDLLGVISTFFKTSKYMASVKNPEAAVARLDAAGALPYPKRAEGEEKRMKFLLERVKEFSAKDFTKHRELFGSLGESQRPHTLFIGCSDSRVVPDLITRSLPGELFVVRNIANIVPWYRESSEFLSTTSAIEYALVSLEVENIVVCGHSNCGGCKALFLTHDELDKLPHTRKWLELAREAKEEAETLASVIGDASGLEWLVEQANIVEQLNHLLSYPMVEERYAAGKLRLYGWYYEIATGTVYDYDQADKSFNKIE
jgi:carbonic anhydrase